MMTNPTMRITQGSFSFLPDLTDAQITAQIDYCLDKGWAVGIEYTDDPHPRNTYWEMWGNPMFDLRDAGRRDARAQRLPQDLPETTTSASTPSTRPAAARRSRCPSSSTGRPCRAGLPAWSPGSATAARCATRIESYAADKARY
jgi:hypothetical protein